VPLRDGFADAGFDTELLTREESVADYPESALLILTGDLRRPAARRRVEEAHDRDHMPVLGVAASEAEAAACRELGLALCLAKPVDVREAVAEGRRMIERRRLRRITGIVGETEAMQEALERVVQFAPVDATVLVTGESGTGKELIARGIHALSARRHRPFIAANVAALPETILESELFGHEKGAFTGAIAQRKGLFELAHKGTLFLDEIGEMPMTTQTKLLRVLEEREFLRVGGETPIRVDVRVITATNRDLRALAEYGQFRRDLYFRLNVLHIAMPPLRERMADIPLLAEAFAREVAHRHDREPVTLSPDAVELLRGYDWPGNIRELRNLVESMGVLFPGRAIRPEDLPSPIRSGAGRRSVPARLPPETPTDGLRPELEFVFRTLVDLRVDLEDLKDRFDAFRRERAIGGGGPALLTAGLDGGVEVLDAEEVPITEAPDEAGPRGDEPESADPGGEDALTEAGAEADRTGEATAMDPEGAIDLDGVVVYRPGMTLEDLEREAITAALADVKGNRRKAAEALGIGERTLYRKIKQYDIPL
jgi:DNA-binding NtrC family response regulator